MNTEPLRAHTSSRTHPPSLDPWKDAELDGSENIAALAIAAVVGVRAGGAGWFRGDCRQVRLTLPQRPHRR